MKQYLDMLQFVLDNGERRSNRTGVDTISTFGYQTRFDLRDGFPLLTTKKLHTKSIIHEMLWFLMGDGSIDYLKKNGVTIWYEWADENGYLGPVYGVQWRKWTQLPFIVTQRFNDEEWQSYNVQMKSGIDSIPELTYLEWEPLDQITELIHSLKTNPASRRHIVTAWNPADVPKQKLPPCHILFQCNVSNDNDLDLHLYMRSADLFLGVPFNIASYALLLSMLAHVTGLKPRHLITSFGDLHIYTNHLDQVKEQLDRKPLPLPQLEIDPNVESIDNFVFDSFNIVNYNFHPAIKAPVAV